MFGDLKIIASKIPAMKELEDIETKLLPAPDED
jgi:hypothetical protein